MITTTNTRVPSAFARSVGVAGRVRPAGQAGSLRDVLAQRLASLGFSSVPSVSVLPDDKIPDLLAITSDAGFLTRFQSLYCHPTSADGKQEYDSDASRTAWMKANPWCPAPPPYVSPLAAKLKPVLQSRLAAIGYGAANLSTLTDAQLSQYAGMSQAGLQSLCSTSGAPWCPPPVTTQPAPPPDFWSTVLPYAPYAAGALVAIGLGVWIFASAPAQPAAVVPVASSRRSTRQRSATQA